jgi:long-chain acyl-CoA synthetase
MRTTVTNYLDDFISRGSATAFAYRRGLRMARWPFAQTARTAFQFARELEARGMGKGDRVLLWAENSAEWVASFFGCVLRGTIVVPLDVQSDPSFVTRVQQQVGAKLFLCDATTRTLADLNIPVLDLSELSSLVAHQSTSAYNATEVGTDETVEIVFTSGTTAEPKGVLITHRNLLANLNPLEEEIEPYLKWERLVHPIRFLNLLPLSHVFGQFMGMFIPPLLGGEVFFQSSLNPSQIIETIKRERISVVVTVPRILDALREKIERDYEARGKLAELRERLESSAGKHFILRWWGFRRIHRMLGWKFWAFISGGATLNPDTEKFWQRLGFAVIQGYGLTETASLISVNHPFKAGSGSIGRAMPGQEVKLGENGEILVRGENVSPGYWQAKTVRQEEDGWFHTGDIGYADEEGNLYFKGRSKEVIVTSAGVNVYPEDIERVLDRQPEIKASAVIEIEGRRGPEPLAVLILRDDVNAKDIIDRTNKSLAQHQQVRRWFVWPGEDFPRTATQKIRKQIVAERVKADLGGAVHSVATSRADPLAEIVSHISKEALPQLNQDAQLGTDLKLDSLGRVELLSALEDRYQVDIDEAAFTDATTLADVEKIIREGKHEAAASYPYPRWQQRWPISWLRIVLLYAVVNTAIRILGWPRIKGAEHLRNVRGPLVFICNHVTMVDHALVLFALPARFKTKMVIAQDGELLREWRHPPVGTGLPTRLLYLLQYFSVVLFFNVFSMPQKSGFRQSFAFAGEMIDRGYNLMVFPEGLRTKHGRMNPFMPGTGLLIQQLGVPVVPMRIDGLWELKAANKHFAPPGEVSVVIGKPMSFPTDRPPEQIARDLARIVKEL